MKKTFLIYLNLILCIMLVSCNTPNDSHICNDFLTDWQDVTPFSCEEEGMQQQLCTKCQTVVNTRTIVKEHELVEETIKEVTCTTNGKAKYSCKVCGINGEYTVYAKGHSELSIDVVRKPNNKVVGKRNFTCSACGEVLKTQNFIENGYTKHGKLSVVGPDLVDQSGEKVQLFGLSTHGLQWFGRYANFDTIASIQEAFGINIIRFAFYTDENGYCDGNEAKKKQMLEDLIEGVDAATRLGLYVIIDWHMVGAENDADKNPLTYLEESLEFFSYITNYYKDQNNILYEIMNEPNGKTTWADCKKYANQVIPVIRENTDAIVLVGNPKWTADLNSVMKSPLEGYENIMYTYHFYAKDHGNTTQVINAYKAGIPVFISEFGFMESSGDGPIGLNNGERWKQVLDQRNISYVAWNISNSKGSASIFKENSYDMVDVSDSNLKEWGIYLKIWYREKSGLDKLIHD